MHNVVLQQYRGSTAPFDMALPEYIQKLACCPGKVWWFGQLPNNIHGHFIPKAFFYFYIDYLHKQVIITFLKII
jgi:hypothetical protein